MDKNTLRMAIANQLKTIDDPTRQTLSRRACQNLLYGIDWAAITRVYCYRSQLKEIDTSWLIEELRTRNQGTIDIAPQTRDAALPETAYDLIIVPLVAFTHDGHRLGRGGGWYDRLLAVQPHAQKIGLAYEQQLVPKIPIERHDVTLDAVFTEAGEHKP